MLEGLQFDFAGRTFTADALLTQRKLAEYLLRRGAHFLFTVKANQPTLLDDIETFFRDRGEPDFREPARLAHGRIETRAVRTTAKLNDHVRCRIRTGHGPENTTRLRRFRLRRFAVGVVRSHTDDCVAAAMRRLHRKPRLVLDYRG